ncbi:MAG: EAL and HDOD domain-containing protein [Rhodocyclaceae bacterium]
MMKNAVSDSHPMLGRQPVLDIHEKLIGYRLAFLESDAGGEVHAAADVERICSALDEPHLTEAFAGLKVFAAAAPGMLFDQAAESLPSESLVLCLDAEPTRDPEVVSRCQVLRAAGFQFCLDINQPSEPLADNAALLGLISFANVDISAADDDALVALLNQAKRHRFHPIAGQVETQDGHRRAVKLGFAYFQGNYFAASSPKEEKLLDPSLHGLIAILNLLNRDAEIQEIERVFKGEPALTIKLLRLTNSASIGCRVRIASVRQAINVIGRRALLRWVQLLMFSRSQNADDMERNPLMQLAALKGRFMEQLARLCFPNQPTFPDTAFLAGLMSLMPVALGIGVKDILDQIDVAPRLRQALQERTGEIGLLLDLTDSFDNRDPSAVNQALGRLGNCIGVEDLNRVLVDSIAWVQGLAVEIK